MDLLILQDRQQLAAYFSQNICQDFYCLGDLDDFYWPYTICLGQDTAGGIKNVVVLYQGEDLPVLLAFDRNGDMDQVFIDTLIPFLPEKFYAHLSPGLECYFYERYKRTEFGDHSKMALQDPGCLAISGLEEICRLTADDLPELNKLYNISYPGNAFDPRMIQSEMYFGVRHHGQLISAGGIHVYSRQFSVAALGNLTTHPDFRNQGMGRQVAARICQELLRSVDFIGLNVKSDNLAAAHLYQTLGFTIISNYGEFSFNIRS